jgi:hypothetical protein
MVSMFMGRSCADVMWDMYKNSAYMPAIEGQFTSDADF